MKAFVIGTATLLCVLASAAASAQGGAGQVGEVVVQENGTPQAPWEQRNICSDDDCHLVIINTGTHEIARVDGEITSLFAASGQGQEIVRIHAKRT